MAKRQDTVHHADVMAVEESLRRLEEVARRLHQRESRRTPEAQIDAVMVPLELRLGDSADAEGSAPRRAAEWLERLRREVRESLLATAAFERGRVYCLRCENSQCEHSLPPSPRSVFVGYGQTGRPEWMDFDQLLQRKGDGRIERLYRRRRELLCCILDHKELYAHLLPGFEALQRRFLVIGQLCVGLFDPPGDSSEPMALTVQIVRSNRGESSMMLDLHVIGRGDRSPRSVVEEQSFPGLSEALIPLRRELRALGRPGKPIPTSGIALQRLCSRSQTLLRDASRDLEHRHRSDGRRTRHAQERTQSRGRPTAKAFEEALRAPRERVYIDREGGTRVVLGQRNRVHVFTPGGKHVTSVVFEAAQIRQRLQRKRWTPIQTEQHEPFRQALRDRTGDDE